MKNLSYFVVAPPGIMPEIMINSETGVITVPEILTTGVTGIILTVGMHTI